MCPTFYFVSDLLNVPRANTVDGHDTSKRSLVGFLFCILLMPNKAKNTSSSPRRVQYRPLVMFSKSSVHDFLGPFRRVMLRLNLSKYRHQVVSAINHFVKITIRVVRLVFALGTTSVFVVFYSRRNHFNVNYIVRLYSLFKPMSVI